MQDDLQKEPLIGQLYHQDPLNDFRGDQIWLKPPKSRSRLPKMMWVLSREASNQHGKPQGIPPLTDKESPL